MSCCGNKRKQLQRVFSAGNAAGRKSGSPFPVSASRGPVYFESVTEGSLEVIGAVTGKRYFFSARGAQAGIDPRDAPSLIQVPGLRHIQRSSGALQRSGTNVGA